MVKVECLSSTNICNVHVLDAIISTTHLRHPFMHLSPSCPRLDSPIHPSIYPRLSHPLSKSQLPCPSIHPSIHPSMSPTSHRPSLIHPPSTHPSIHPPTHTSIYPCLSPPCPSLISPIHPCFSHPNVPVSSNFPIRQKDWHCRSLKTVTQYSMGVYWDWVCLNSWYSSCCYKLQPHQKHNITQYEELGFYHNLLRWEMNILPILTSTWLIYFSSKG